MTGRIHLWHVSPLSLASLTHVLLVVIVLLRQHQPAAAAAMSTSSPNAGAHFKPGWNGLGRTPPLAWRSWNAFGGRQNNQPGIDTATIEAAIDAIVKQRPNPWHSHNGHGTALDGRGAATISLCDAGFCSVGIDEGWETCTLPLLGNVTVCQHLHEPTSNCDGNSYCCPSMAGNANHFCTQHNAAGDPMINSLFGGLEVSANSFAHARFLSSLSSLSF